MHRCADRRRCAVESKLNILCRQQPTRVRSLQSFLPSFFFIKFKIQEGNNQTTSSIQPMHKTLLHPYKLIDPLINTPIVIRFFSNSSHLTKQTIQPSLLWLWLWLLLLLYNPLWPTWWNSSPNSVFFLTKILTELSSRAYAQMIFSHRTFFHSKTKTKFPTPPNQNLKLPTPPLHKKHLNHRKLTPNNWLIVELKEPGFWVSKGFLWHVPLGIMPKLVCFSSKL